MNKIIDIHIKSQFLNIMILGFLLTLAGIIFLIQTQYVGFIPFVLGLIILSLKKGVLINTDTKEIKYYKKIAFITLGNWEDCKEVRYIALTPVKITQKMHAVTIPGTYSDMRIKLSFIYDNKRVVGIHIDKKTKISLIAKQIADGFNVDIYDNSDGKKEWIRIKT